MMELLGNISDEEVAKLSGLVMLSFPSIEARWEEVSCLLLQGQDTWRPYETLSSLKRAFKDGDFQLFVYLEDGCIDTLCVTSLYCHATGLKELSVHYLIGENFFNDFAKVSFLHKGLELFAERGGYNIVTMKASLGFRKTLKRMGYKAKEAVYYHTVAAPSGHERMN